MGFEPATRKRRKARIALSGPTGSGKTYTALTLASALGGKIAVLDTEGGRALDYADVFDFDHAELGKPYSPQRYIAAMADAAKTYQVLLIDSLSHAWFGPGGVLDIVDDEAARNRGNKFAAWRKGTPAHNGLLEALAFSPCHIIVTMRSKMAYEVVEDGGKKRVNKLGLEPVQRDGVEYEFSLFAEMDQDHRMIVTKSTMSQLQDAIIEKPGIDTGAQIASWLNSGDTPPESRPPTPSGDVAGTAPREAGPTGQPSRPDPGPASEPKEPPKPSPAQQKDLARMHALGSELGIDHDGLRTFASATIGADLESLKDLSEADRKEVLTTLQKKVNEQRKAAHQSVGAEQGDGYADQTDDAPFAKEAPSDPAAGADASAEAPAGQGALT